MTSKLVSIIVPTLNEAQVIEKTLKPLQSYRDTSIEIIVTDGGSKDGTLALSKPLADIQLQSSQGRARQMNAGAEKACGEWLLFLHADTLLPEPLDGWLASLQSTDCCWGFFPVCLSGEHFLFRIIERAINWRSRLTSVATGDQCIFVRRTDFFALGGYPDIPLMEDVSISKSLGKCSSPFVFPLAVISSSRRWEQYGVLKTVLLMWCLRLAYFLGVDPRHLVKRYG